MLKPNNVYESLAALLQADPDLSIIGEIIRRTNISCMYDNSSYTTYDGVNCCAFGYGAYVGNGDFCGAGEDLYFDFYYTPRYICCTTDMVLHNVHAERNANACMHEYALAKS